MCYYNIGDRMKKISMKRWLIVTMLFAIFANIAHPVTPKFIKELGLGDSMFGWAYAGMAITNFLFSPLWAKLCEKYGSVKVTSVSLFFYGISQLMFGLSTTAFSIMFARLFGGFFIGGLHVSQLVYIVNNSSDDEKGQAMVNNSTIQIVFGTIGFLVGGMIGDINIMYAFYFQAAGLILSVFYVMLFVGERDINASEHNLDITEMNPFTSLSKSSEDTSVFLRNIFIVSILASTATVLYDQTFNYYMADFFNFPPSVNGTIKAITGVLAFISNSTLTYWMIKKTNLSKSLGFVFVFVSALIIGLISIDVPLLFLGINVVYFAIHASYIPIIQKIVTDNSKDQSAAVGKINSLKSLGMIIGAIVAGQAYAISKQLPFILASLIFIISGFITLINRKNQSVK